MLKGILLSVVLLSCAGIGRALSNARKKRLDVLGELLAAMRVLRLRMLNSMEPIGILLRKSEAQLFCDIGKNLYSGNNLKESWQYFRENAKRHVDLSALLECDLHILDTFFHSLGRSGREEQNELFSNVISEMEDAQMQAKSKYTDAAKLYTALGTLVGIAVCVLIV